LLAAATTAAEVSKEMVDGSKRSGVKTQCTGGEGAEKMLRGDV